jgi:hypothetical protein
MFKITKDHIAEVERGDKSREGMVFDRMPQYGMERAMGLDDRLPEETTADARVEYGTVPFRLYDDDGELHYEGELHDDPECINQMAALRFGESDTGCTRIEVRRGPEWVQEIG